MAWGLDDLAKLVNGLRNTFDGGRPGQVGNRNVQDAIVKPGKVLSDFSGISQGYKGAGPDASNMDRSMALLALAGMLGGQEAAMGLKNVASPAVRGGKNVLLDIFGPKAEMFHASPVSGLNKLQPFVAPAAGTAYGAPKPYVYLAQGDDVANKIAGYLDTAGSMGFDAAGNKIDNITKTGSIYKTKVPLHRLESYGGPASSSFRRTSKPVKVAGELKANQMPRKEFLAALQKFVG